MAATPILTPMDADPPASTADEPPVTGRGPLRRRLRLALWAAAVAVLLAGTPALFYALRGGRVLSEPQTLRAGWMALSAVCVGLFALLASTPPDAIRLSPRLGKRVILIAAALMAAAAVAWLVPLLSPEPLRHRFDGKIWLLGDSPYLTSPADAAAQARTSRDAENRPDALDAAAPAQNRTTLTLPAGQAFLAAGRAGEYLLPGEAAAPADRPAAWRALLADSPWWRRLLTWRCVLAAGYLVTIGELVAWLRQRKLSVWWAAVFAWQPLVLVESTGMGHQDVLGAMFLVAGLRRADLGRFRRAAISLAASAAVQPVALLALPFVLRQAWQAPPGDPAAGGNGAAARRAAVWFAATLLLLLLPLATPAALANLADAASQYAYGPSPHAAVYRGIEGLFLGPGESGRATRVRTAGWLLCGAATLAAGAVAWVRRAGPTAALYAMTLAGLLLSPISPPWALVWPLALVPALGGRGGLAALVWSATAVLAYSAGTLWWQLTPVVLAAAAELWPGRRPVPS